MIDLIGHFVEPGRDVNEGADVNHSCPEVAMLGTMLIPMIMFSGAFWFSQIGNDCQMCHQSYRLGVIYHFFENDEGEGSFTCAGTDGGECHQDEIKYPCDSNHNPCNGLAAALEDVENVFASNIADDVEETKAFLAAYPEHVILNVQHRSIQLLDCQQLVAAVIPVEAAVLRAVAPAE